MIAAQEAEQIIPGGYVEVAPTESQFYIAIVTTFADIVAEGLTKVNTSGGAVDP